MTLTGALCAGRSWLWDSTEPADHQEAAAECAICPALAACRQLLTQELAQSAGIRGQGGGPRGTWAGQLLRKPNPRDRNPREHATDRGYYQHRYYRETVCDECVIAHRLAQRARKERAS